MLKVARSKPKLTKTLKVGEAIAVSQKSKSSGPARNPTPGLSDTSREQMLAMRGLGVFFEPLDRVLSTVGSRPQPPSERRISAVRPMGTPIMHAGHGGTGPMPPMETMVGCQFRDSESCRSFGFFPYRGCSIDYLSKTHVKF
jgi:hypothetical protein